MKNHSTTLFWILTDTLLILGFAFFPSFFSICSILMALIFVPIDSWQNLLNRFLKKPIKAAVIALGIAFVISNFPLSTLVTSVYKLANPDINSPNKTSSVVYYEEHSSAVSSSSKIEDTHSELSTTSDTTSVTSNTSKKASASSKVSTSSKSSKPSTPSTSSNKTNSVKKETYKTNIVYRTPNGKRYHYSASCGGKNSYKVSYDDAVNDGLTPCKKCVE